MDGRHPGLVRYVGGALHSDSKEQTTMKETGSLRDLRPSVLRTECDDDDEYNISDLKRLFTGKLSTMMTAR